MTSYLLWGACTYASVLFLSAILPLEPLLLGLAVLFILGLVFRAKTFVLGLIFGCCTGFIALFMSQYQLLPAHHFATTDQATFEVRITSDPQVSAFGLGFQGTLIHESSRLDDKGIRVFWPEYSDQVLDGLVVGSVWRLPLKLLSLIHI